jgi:type II secretory pathway pseudopilin PulG
MSWISAFVELNKSLLLKGLLLLMAFLLGLQMGQSRLQRQWDAEKQFLQIAQAKQEQRATDVAQIQNQISKEISDDYRKKSSLLASRAVVAERVLDNYESNSDSLSAVSTNSEGVTDGASDIASAPFRDEVELLGCGQLRQDATQTTLMLIEIQRWYLRAYEAER